VVLAKVKTLLCLGDTKVENSIFVVFESLTGFFEENNGVF